MRLLVRQKRIVWVDTKGVAIVTSEGAKMIHHNMERTVIDWKS